MEFAEEGGEGADAVRGAAARGDGRRQHALHPPGRRRGDAGGSCSRCSTHRRRSTRTRRARGARGGGRAGRRPRPLARPWMRVMSGHRDRPSRAAERGRAVAVPADRRLRVPVRLPHGRAVAPDGAIDWLCVPASTRRACSAACSTARPGSFRFGPFGINHPTARVYEPGRTSLVTTWKTPTGWIVVRDALTMGPRDARGRGHPAHAACRPTTTPSTCSSGPSNASRAASRSSSSASPLRLRALDPLDARRRQSDLAETATARPSARFRPGTRSRRHRVRARHTLEAGEPRSAAVVGRTARRPRGCGEP